MSAAPDKTLTAQQSRPALGDHRHLLTGSQGRSGLDASCRKVGCSKWSEKKRIATTKSTASDPIQGKWVLMRMYSVQTAM